MKEFDHEFKTINSKLIHVDQRYQRKIKSEREINDILKDFDPNIVDEPHVSFRDGIYWVFQGQHTVVALKKRNGGEDLMINCKVYYGMSYEDEAILFAKQRGHEKRVTIEEKLNGFDVGGDENVKNFKRLIESFGYVCDFSKESGYGRLCCYSTAFRIYSQVGGASRLSEILHIVSGAWDLDADGVRGNILDALNIILRNNENHVDDARMIKKLAPVSVTRILKEGSKMDKGGNKRYAKVIADFYNSGIHKQEKRLIVRW